MQIQIIVKVFLDVPLSLKSIIILSLKHTIAIGLVLIQHKHKSVSAGQGQENLWFGNHSHCAYKYDRLHLCFDLVNKNGSLQGYIPPSWAASVNKDMTIKQYDLHNDIQEGGDQTLCNIEIVLTIAAHGHDEICCHLYQGRKYRMLCLCLSVAGTNL